MGGILDFLRMAVPGAAAARTGYMQGQDQEQDKQRELERQGVLDKLKAAMDQSTMDENSARAQFYRDGGAGGDAVQYITDKDGNVRAMPKRIRGAATGESAGGSSETMTPPSADDNFGGRTTDATSGATSGAAPRATAATTLGVATGVKALPKAPPAAPRVTKPNTVNPAMGTIEDVYSDGTRKTIRKATPEELAKVNRVPGSGTGTAGGARPMNPKLTEAYLQSIADRALQASGGDVQKAEFAVANDPNGQQAYSRGLATRHFQSAKARFDRQTAIDMDVHPTMDTTNAKAPPRDGTAPKPTATAPKSGSLVSTMKAVVGSPPPNYRGAAPSTGTPGDINLGAVPDEKVSTGDLDATNDEIVQEAARRIRAGLGTLAQAKAAGMSAARLAALQKLLAAGKPK